MASVKSSPTEEWFRHEVLNPRCLYVAAWSFFVQSFLIWAIKFSSFSISSVFGFYHIPTSTVIYCQIYLAFLVLGLNILYFKNIRVSPQLSLSPLSSLLRVFDFQSWFRGASFVTLGALWTRCLLSLLSHSHHAHFWEQTTSCLSDSAECCVSEHHLFIVLYGAFVGFCFCLTFEMEHLYCLRFETVQQLKLPSIKMKLKDQIKNSAVAVTKYLRSFYVLYYILGFIPKLFVSSFLYQSFCDHDSLTSFSGLLDVKLFFTAWLLGFVVHTSFAVTNSLVQVFLTERYSFPVDVSFERDNFKVLAKAIAEANSELLQFLAFQNFSFISQHAPESRQKIFAVSNPGGHPHTWNLISSRCLEVLEQFQSSLSEAAVTTSFVQMATTPQATSTPVLVRTPSANGITRFSDPTSALPSPQRPLDAFATPLLRSTFKGRNMSVAGSSPQPYYTSTPAEPLIKFEKVFHIKMWLTQAAKKVVDNMMNKALVKFLVVEQSDRKLEKLFCSCHTVIWSVQGLCFLVRASYLEDRHGVVQWSLPKIISTLLNLQMALERTPKGLLRVSSSRDLWSAFPKGLCLRQSLRASLNSGLYHIACTFKDHLKYVELSEDHRNRMERYIQMKE